MLEGIARRWFWIGAVLAVTAGILGVARPWEPGYQGKSVGGWFDDYVSYPSETGAIREASLAEWSVGAGIRQYGGRILLDPRTRVRLPDPPLSALQALGPRAVDSLVRQLRPGAEESLAYARLHLRLPDTLREHLPSPWRSAHRRGLAVEALASLGPDAAGAVPALLTLMDSERLNATRRPGWITGGPGTPRVQMFSLFSESSSPAEPIAIAIASILRDPQSRSAMIRDLDRKGSHHAAVELLEASGWSGPEVPGILGNALHTPDSALRQKALQLLEGLGGRSAEVSIPILTSLQDPDGQVRYRAARALEASGANSPQVVTGLRTATRDTNDMVRTVAARALSRLAPKTSSAP